MVTQPLFLMNTLISRAMKKLILTVFDSVLGALVEEWIFEGPYSAILEVLYL